MIGGQSIAGFVITYNEEKNIRECLESMQWADELVVVDSYSDDDTVEIARQYTDRIVQREFSGYVDQTGFAFEQTTCDWALWLDADERLTPQAVRDIREVFERPGGADRAGYSFPRKTFFLGRWIMHGGWYQHKLRLLRRDVSGIAGDALTPKATVDGDVGKLRGEILHYSYPGGVIEMVQRSATYADIAARGRFEEGRRFSLPNLLLKPPFAFFERYFLKLGLLDGLPGLVIAAAGAHYRFVRETKMWELQRGNG